MIEILTGFLVLITGIYAWATFRILKANEAAVEAVRDQSERLTRPYVVVSTFGEVGTKYLHLKVANTGKSSAERLRLRIDRPLPIPGRRDLGAAWIFANEVPSFPPGSELVFMLGVAQSLLRAAREEGASETPLEFVVSAEYEAGGRRYTEATPLDLRQYLSSTLPREPVAEQLQEIHNLMYAEQVRRNAEREWIYRRRASQEGDD